MNLGRSFFSLYFLIISCFGALSWVLDEFWSLHVEQKVESYTGYKTLLKVLEGNISRFPVSQWKTWVEGQQEYFDLPLLLVDRENIQSLIPEMDSISDGVNTVFYDSNHITLFHPIASQDKVFVLGPVLSPTRPRTEALVRVFIVITLGIVIFFWVWPISKDLDKLNDTVKEFGQGDFNAKITGGTSVLVRPMMNTFNMMAARINGLIEAHKELTNAVSHELRTPLARSKFALEVLRKAQDEEVRQDYINKIAFDVEELESLVNELLVYAAFENEQPNMSISRNDLAELVRYQSESFAGFDGKLSVDVASGSFMAEYDSHFINRALSNLITNAFKYGDGEVKISLTSDAKFCYLSVEDNGPGIDEEFKKIIFDAFSRHDKSRTRDTGGFGLGLAIVNKIMQWHNGSAVIGDSELGGAKFTLTWPINHLTV